MEHDATAPIRHKADASAWPPLIALAIVLVAVAATLRSVTALVAALILAAVGVGGWLREAGREHEAGSREVEHDEGPEDFWQRRTRQGMLVAAAVAVDSALFIAGWRAFAAHDLFSQEAWPPAAGAVGAAAPLAMGLLLFAGAAAMQWGAGWHRMEPSHARVAVGAALAGAAGVAFLVVLATLYARLGAAGFTLDTGAAASGFYWVTGLHAAHVVVALVLVVVLLARVALGGLPVAHRHAEGTAIFWGYIALVWLAVYAFAFLRVVDAHVGHLARVGQG